MTEQEIHDIVYQAVIQAIQSGALDSVIHMYLMGFAGILCATLIWAAITRNL